MSSSRRSQPKMYRLTVEGRSVSFRRGERVRIGRHPDNELVLDDTSVSRFHARVEWSRRPGAPVILDLGSSNGTYVDGVRRARATLTELSKIVVGDVRLTMLLVDPGVTGATRVRMCDERWPDSSGYLRAAEGVHALLLELERAGRTASFKLTSEEGFEAQVKFARGQIVDARAGGARGLDALTLLLTRTSGGCYAVTREVEAKASGDALPRLSELLTRVTSRAS